MLIRDQHHEIVSIRGEDIESSRDSLMPLNLLTPLRRDAPVDLLASLTGLKVPHSCTTNRGAEKQ